MAAFYKDLTEIFNGKYMDIDDGVLKLMKKNGENEIHSRFQKSVVKIILFVKTGEIPFSEECDK